MYYKLEGKRKPEDQWFLLGVGLFSSIQEAVEDGNLLKEANPGSEVRVKVCSKEEAEEFYNTLDDCPRCGDKLCEFQDGQQCRNCYFFRDKYE